MPVTGGASLLVIFAVLCLTVFTLLTLSTAKADKRLSEVYVASVEQYYAADLQAEEIFARLRNGEIPEGVTVDGDTYSYSCEISPTQSIQVCLRYSQGEWTVLRWQSVSSNI